MAKQYYKPKTYEHALRVAEYVSENPMIQDDKMDDCIALAIMHDLIEDTEYAHKAKNDLYNPESRITNNKYFYNCLHFLTKEPEDNYIKYIKK